MTERLKPVQIGGQWVWAEVDDATPVTAPPAVAPKVPGDRDLAPTARPNDVPRETLPQAAVLGRMDIAPTLQAVMEPVKAALQKAPGLKEVTVEVALGIKGEVGFFIAKGESNGSVKVSAKWAPPS